MRACGVLQPSGVLRCDADQLVRNDLVIGFVEAYVVDLERGAPAWIVDTLDPPIQHLAGGTPDRRRVERQAQLVILFGHRGP